jgi:3-dehydroquinate dehydratase/shikimate dehydrogenase
MPFQPLKLCVSLLPQNIQQVQQLISGTDEADLVELRLDVLGKIPFSEILEKINKPLIITIRESEEGGIWKGSRKEKIEILNDAIKAGVHYLDIEWKEAPELLNQLKLGNNTELILSYHADTNDLDKLKQTLREMLVLPAYIYKLVYKAGSLNDCVTIFPLIHMVKNSGKRCVIHAMGESGQVSRMIGALAGNAWTYVSHPDFPVTAEGQIGLDMARHKYFLHEKSRNTRIIGLLGFPIKQSSGWKLHNRLLHEVSTDIPEKRDAFLYLNLPAEDFDGFWKIWSEYLDGLSITIPHKKNIINHLNYRGKSVDLSGACNTAIKRDNYWYGFNTDFLAIFELLKECALSEQEIALVYGTGATARSTIAAMQQLHVKEIFLTGRNDQKGQALAEEFGIRFQTLDQLNGNSFSAIFQTTPVGMYPQNKEAPPLIDILKPGMLVFDVIYNPPITHFLEQASEIGCRIISGEMMYLRQAYRQFELFSGYQTSLEMVEKIWREL